MASSGMTRRQFMWLFRSMLGLVIFGSIPKSGTSQAKVCGFVKNEKGTPVAFASVTAGHDSAKPATIFAITNKEGFFNLPATSSAQKIFLTVTHLQFEEKRISFTVHQPSGNCPDIVLQERTGTLSPVVVTPDRPITMKGDTIVFNTKSFSNGNERSILELVGKLPGITVLEDGKLLFNGQLIEHLLFEGEDMSGRNYMDIIRNIGPTGIEQVELIHDYSDMSDIGSGLLPTQKKALNLRFGEDHISRLFGQLGVSGGLPHDTYSANNNTLFLGKKTKLVAFGNFNTTGNLVVSQYSKDALAASESGAIEVTLPVFKSLARIESVKTNPLNHEQISENTSGIANCYLKITPWKNTRFQVGLRYANDKFQQSGSSVTTFTLPPAISRSTTLNDLNRLIDVNINGNIQFNKRNQLLLLARKHAYKVQQNEQLRLLNQSYTNDLTGIENQEGGMAIWNHLTRRNALIRADVQFSTGRLPLVLQQTPSNFSAFFFPGDAIASITQDEHQRMQRWLSSLTFTKQIGKYRIILKASHNLDRHKLQNDITGIYLNGFKNSYDSTIQTETQLHNSKLEIVSNTSISEKIELTTGFALNHISLSNHNNKFAALNKWLLLPDVNLSWKLSTHKSLALNFRQKTVVASTEQFSSGYSIQSDVHIERGAFTPGASLASSLKLSFSSNDIPRNGRLFYISIALQQTPMLFLPEIVNDPQFSIIRLTSINKYLGLVNFFVKLDQSISTSRWRLLSDFTYTHVNTASTLNGNTVNNTLYNLKYSLGVKYFSKSAEYLLRTEFRNLIQRNKAYAYRNSNTFFITQSSFAQKIRNNYWGSFDIRSMFIWGSQNQPQHITIMNAGINRSSANGKWQFGLKASNILNQRTITKAILSATYVTTEQFNLFPRYINAKVQYSF